LVLAREVLRDPVHGAVVRGRLHQRYQRLLLDEFQDTDPIQAELAVRIAAGAPATGATWQEVAVPPGRVFIVGDPKQSIYRFRRADIAMYLRPQGSLGEAVRLTTNFRTTRSVLAWINATFEQLITAVDGSQPAFHPLDPHRADAPDGSAVVALGVTAHPPGTGADAVRSAEAADVAAAVRTALAERWQVFDQRDRRWRDVELGDIAVLVPARTSLPHLEEALERGGIPYRAEASSLVYRTSEVRDLLMAARAVDDPSDSLALVSALRSPLFGCGDDDLLTWKRGGGSFNLLAPPGQGLPPAPALGHPVGEGIGYLRALHDEHTWLAPSELLDRIVRDRRMLEVAGQVRSGAGSRTRDVWRRLRFVIDHARAWSESERGGLRGYLAWAARQGDESSRVAEAILPETDDDAVRIMTIHAAKGLEFPVVIVSGLSSRPLTSRGVEVLWPATGGYALKVGATMQTGDFEVAKPIDEQMGHHERIRLLYVAATRARDHLVVSLHRAPRQALAAPQARTNAELLFTAYQAGPPMRELVAAGLPPVPAAPSQRSAARVEPFERWQARVTAARTVATRRSAVSASSLEGSDVADPGLAKGARDLELPPWNKGRYGTAIGRAVHGALQTVDLATGAGLEQAVSAQALAEGVLPHADIVLALCRSALESATVRRAAERPHWRETYVGTPAGSSRLADRLPNLHDEWNGPGAAAAALAAGAVLEGYIDLLYRQDDGSLVIVDYKTDAVPAAAVPGRVAHYRPQMQAYALALSEALGEPVRQAVLLFLHPQGAFEESVSLSVPLAFP
jgi:ATP-dependent helicase/nuclease subunit A